MAYSKERCTSEKKINHDRFSLKLGTTNRYDPIVVYVEGRAWISPNIEKDTYRKDISEMKRSLTNSIRENLRKTNLFEGAFILDFQIPQNGVARNKKSYLSFQVMLSQKKNRVLKLKDVYKEANETITNIVSTFENSIYEHDFSIFKKKGSSQ